MKTHRLQKLGTLVGAMSLLALTGLSHHSSAKDGNDGKLKGLIESQLATSDSRAIYVMTDKPLYHPGETVWFRSFELSRKTMAAPAGDHGMTFQIFDPKGGKLLEKRVQAHQGGATNDFVLPSGLAGGQYTLRATTDLGGTEDKSITVSSYETPRVKKSVELARKSYGPGEEVSATVHVERATGDAISFGKLTAIASVDGVEVSRQNITTDFRGFARVRFTLPKSIEKGDATLTVLVNDGGSTESIQKRVPIVLDHLALVAYPEGGDLIAGLPGRVYFAARDPLGKPIETEGNVVDDSGTTVAHFKSFHAGMGRFDLTPVAGRSYTLKVSKPIGIAQTFAVPAAKSTGCALQSDDDYTSAKPEVRVKVWCKDAQTVSATAVVRDRLVGQATSEVGSYVPASPSAPAPSTTMPAPAAKITWGPTTISLPVGKDAIGATRVTLFDGAMRPLAERVVYRGLRSGLHVSVTPDKTAYAPREKVTLTLKATDGEGKPVQNADLALSVVDDTVLNFADDKTPNMLARLYLEPEMPGQKIFEPNFYFGTDAKAPQALDLLLGTLGYRRFEWKWVKKGQ
jgi:hypothetical protein